MSKLKITLNFKEKINKLKKRKRKRKKAPKYIFWERQTKQNFLGTQVFLNAEYNFPDIKRKDLTLSKIQLS